MISTFPLFHFSPLVQIFPPVNFSVVKSSVFPLFRSCVSFFFYTRIRPPAVRMTVAGVLEWHVGDMGSYSNRPNFCVGPLFGCLLVCLVACWLPLVFSMTLFSSSGFPFDSLWAALAPFCASPVAGSVLVVCGSHHWFQFWACTIAYLVC